MQKIKKKKLNDSVKSEVKEEGEAGAIKTKNINYRATDKWYEEARRNRKETANDLSNEEVQKLRNEASSALNEEVIINSSKTPKSLTKSDYAWVRTVLAKGTKTDKIAAYTLLIQESPLYNLSLLKNMVEMVKVGKNKECFMAIDTLCELFLNDLLPPNEKLLSFSEQPLSKLNEITSGNVTSRKRRLLLWFFEDQLKYYYGNFVASLNKIAHDTVDANKQKVITVMCKLLNGHPEMENVLLNNIVNKLGDPSHKVGSKVIYVLTKLLETHPNMREVVVDAVERVIFRSNISKRAQYYSICFLTQFCLFKEDAKLAKQLISIYLSLFKACIKTGDVDSRMMGALLTGVNRAYPFAKEDLGMLQDHINTIYKVIHLSHASIAIQALSLVYLVSDYSNAYVDRFYSALYKKIAEPELFKSSHHAMFLSLIFKALKRDKERARICAIIKRLLQICTYVPVQIACGILIMISEIMKMKKDILLKETTASENITVKLEEDSDDGEEHYEDVKEEGDPVPFTEVADDVKPEKPIVAQLDKNYNIEQPEQKVWTNPDKSGRDIEISKYDPFVRNPLYSGGDKTLCYELFKLYHHFHPTVSLFANKILKGNNIHINDMIIVRLKDPHTTWSTLKYGHFSDIFLNYLPKYNFESNLLMSLTFTGERIIYSGDPLQDFTLIRFLDKFSFKNPKVIKSDEEKNLTFSKFGRKKYYTAATVRRLRANTADYLNHSEKNIPVDEMYLYRYMKEKWKQGGPSTKREDDSDLESVGSDEFDEMMSDLVDGKRDDINFMNEIGGKLPKKEKSKNEEESDSEMEFGGEGEDDSESEDMAEDFDGDEMDDFKDDDLELQGSETDEDALEAELEASGIKVPKLLKTKGSKNAFKKKDKKGFGDNLFASAEEFSSMLEEADYNAGGSEALSNKDKADAKQLKWESDRDKWIHKKNYRSKNIKRPWQAGKHQKMQKREKKKRY